MKEDVLLSDFEVIDESEDDLYYAGIGNQARESMKGDNWFGSWVGDDEVATGSDIGEVEAKSDTFHQYIWKR